MSSVDVGAIRILIGPSSNRAIESVEWPGAAVRYLTKERSGECNAAHVCYDPDSVMSRIADTCVPARLSEFIIELNADINCFYLAERERRSLFDGALLAPVSIANYARFAWLILYECRPTLVIFHSRPHDLFTYILRKLALDFDLPTLLLNYSALPWRTLIAWYERDGTVSKVRLASVWTQAQLDSVNSYMQRLRSSHRSAIPFNNRRWIAPGVRTLHFGEELRSLLAGSVVTNLVRILKKWSLYRAFRRSVTQQPPLQRFVVFLLHYQPEESTIPRGGLYSQQLNAIVKLRALLPPEVTLLIKENKTTFRAQLTLAMGVRSPEFYRTIARLPGTYLVPLEQDTFELIDNALAVATISGTAGLEALCRGRKVFVFGDASYDGFAGVSRLDAAPGPSVPEVLYGPAHDAAATRQDLLQEVLCSTGGDVDDNAANDRLQQSASVAAFEYVSQNLQQLLARRTRVWRAERPRSGYPVSG